MNFSHRILEHVVPRLDGDECCGLIAVAVDISVVKTSEALLTSMGDILKQEVAERISHDDAIPGAAEYGGLSTPTISAPPLANRQLHHLTEHDPWLCRMLAQKGSLSSPNAPAFSARSRDRLFSPVRTSDWLDATFRSAIAPTRCY